MSTRSRLSRIESALRPRATEIPVAEAVAYVDAQRKYRLESDVWVQEFIAGTAGPPPRPPSLGVCSAEYFVMAMRAQACIEARMMGLIVPDGYLSGMLPADQLHADRLCGSMFAVSAILNDHRPSSAADPFAWPEWEKFNGAGYTPRPLTPDEEGRRCSDPELTRRLDEARARLEEFDARETEEARQADRLELFRQRYGDAHAHDEPGSVTDRVNTLTERFGGDTTASSPEE